MNIGKTRLKSLSRVLKVFFDVFFWASIIPAAAGFLFLIATFFISENFFAFLKEWEGLSAGIISGVIKFNINPQLYDNMALKQFFQTLLLMVAVPSSILIIINHNLRLILKTVVNDRPFERNNAKRLFVIGIVLIASSVIWKTVEGLFILTAVNMMQFENIDINFTIDGTMLFTGFLILILAGIFRYGSYLQEEYDTTL